ncbi:MAG: YggU family protein [Acidobacteria bacterium]|nr:YggU family protein [Acidobacteriota bacterium]
MIRYREEPGALIFSVRVAPRAGRTAAAGEHGGALKVRVAAPPVEGAANAELVRFLAKQFGVPASAVEVVGGRASKSKVVRAAGAKAEDLLRLAAEG